MHFSQSLRRLGGVAVAAACVLAVSTAASAKIDDFPGKWVNVDAHTDNLTKVHIDMTGPMGVDVHGWGQCHPTDCDWGTVHGQFIPGGGGTVRAVFNTSFKITTLELHNAPGQSLTYDMHAKFIDNSGRAPYDVHGVLARAGDGGPMGGGGMGGGGMGGGMGMGGAPMGPQDCLPEPYQNLQVAHVGGEWKIVNGNEWVLSFGANKQAADQSLSIIQHYRFDQICYVQRPHPSMTYWTRGNDVPGGSTPGEDCIAFHPHQVAAAHVGGEWKVVDGAMWMLSYGSNQAGADQAVAVIKHYHLNRQCFVARPNPPMEYWLSE
jgi:hypothetical protein